MCLKKNNGLRQKSHITQIHLLTLFAGFLLPTPLWKMARVPSESPTRTRPFTCLRKRNKHLKKIPTHQKLKNLSEVANLPVRLHDAEHGVLQLDGVQALLPLSHRGVDVHTGTHVDVSVSKDFNVLSQVLFRFRFKLTTRSEPPATSLAERCSFSGPPLSSGPALLCWGSNSHRPLAGRFITETQV